MGHALSRRGVSATVATIFGVVALLLGMVAFTAVAVYLARMAYSGSAMAGAYAGESKALVKVYAVLDMEKSGDTVVNKTYLIFENLWPDELTVDHVAVASKSGGMMAEKPLNIKLKPGESVQMKPSDIDPSLSIYDEDFWRFKREVGYFEIHVDVGGAGSSFKSYPEYKVGSSPLEMVTTTVGGSTATTTVTKTVTSTITTTPTSTMTATSTSTYTYVTTPTTTVTTTCTYTTCSQVNLATTYAVVRVTAPTTVVVTETSYTRLVNCYILSTSTITSYLTSTTTTPSATRIGSTTCGVCGRCPTGVYSASSYQPAGQDVYTPYASYLTAPIIALALAPTRLSPRRWWRPTQAAITLTILVLLLTIPQNVGAQTITVTVTGTTTTSTVTTTVTTTLTSTAPATTVTATITTTVTVTSTAPTSTYTVTSTKLSTEYRCYRDTTTITITERPITISTTTKYTSSSCAYAWPITVTVTKVSIWSTVTAVYYVDTYWVVCQRTV